MISVKKNWQELSKRCLLLFIGLVVMAFGVAFSIKSGLGTSSVSSVPYVLSLISPLSMGNATILFNILFILIQIILLLLHKRKYRLIFIQLFQLPAVSVFGVFIDIALSFVQQIGFSSYFQQWILCIIGILFVGIGVYFTIKADLVVLPGEGLVLTLYSIYFEKLRNVHFGYLKITFDVLQVLIAVILSFLFLHRLAGVREGTLAAALLVGLVVKWCDKILLFFNKDTDLKHSS